MKKTLVMTCFALLINSCALLAVDVGGAVAGSKCVDSNEAGIAAFKEGKYEESLAFFENARNCWLAENSNEETVDTVTALDNEAYVFSAVGMYDKSAEIYARSLTLWKNLKGAEESRIRTAYSNLAVALTNNDDYKGSIKIWESLLEYLAAVPGGMESDDAAIVYQSLARMYYATDRQQKALESYDLAIGIVAKNHGENYEYLATLIANRGYVYQDMGELDKALADFDKAYEIVKATQGAETADAANLLVAKGGINAALNKYKEALDYYDAAVKILEALGEKGRADLAIAYNNIASSVQAFGDYAKALEYFEKALNIEIEYAGPDSARVAQRYNNIGYIYYATGDYAKALESYNTALEKKIKLFGDKSADVALTLNNIALVYKTKGDYDRATEYYTKGLDINLEVYGDKHPNVGIMYDNIGNVFDAKGEYEKGLENHLKAYEIFKGAYGEKHVETAIAMNNIAAAYSELEQYSKAAEFYLNSYEAYTASIGEMNPDVAKVLDNLGVVFRKVGENAKALELHLKALDIFIKLLGENHQDVAVTYNNVAIAQEALGQSEEAIVNYDKAIKIWTYVFGENHPAVGTGHNNIGLLHQNANRDKEAVEEFKIALKTFCGGTDAIEPKNCEPGTATVGSFWFAAYSMLRLGDYEDSAKYYEWAAEALDMLRGEMESQGAKKRFGSKYYEMFPEGLAAFAALAEKDGGKSGDRAFVFAEKGIGRVFLEMLGQSQAKFNGGLPDSISADGDKLETELQAALELVQAEASKPKAQQSQDVRRAAYQRLHEAQAALDAYKKKLFNDFPAYADLMHPSPKPLSEIRPAILKQDEAALEYIIGNTDSWLIVITADKTKILKLPGREKIENLVKIFRNKLLNPSIKPESLKKSAANLYEALIAPAAGDIADKKALLIVPTGTLFFLPFESLASGTDEASEFLLKKFTIRYAPGLNVLYMSSARGRQSAKGTGWIGFGDPVYSATDPRVSGKPDAVSSAETTRMVRAFLETEMNENPEIPRIPATGDEVRAVSETMKGSEKKDEAHTGLDANEKNVKKAVDEGYGIMHIASHGTLGAGDGFEPALILSTVGDMGGEDGFLKMSEVFDMKLKADIMVLSACETGRGALEKGEGVAGMSRAFLYAGAKSLVVSLWSVADAETKDLMIGFYKNMTAGLSAEDALRASKIEMLDKGLSPYYWAPFILTGNTK